MPHRRVRRTLKLHNFADDVEHIDVGLTPLPLEGVPEHYRQSLVEIQRAQHDNVNKLSKAIAEYDTRYNEHGYHVGGEPRGH
jgi:hypothetical protein